MNRFKWFFMSKWKKFLYSIPIWHSNEQRFHLGNGYILDFKTMKIETEDMNMLENILKEILSMGMDEINTFKITDDRFLFVNNYCVDGENFTSLELNSGKETEDGYELDSILECGTYDFGNEKDIRSGIDYMIACCR